MQEPVLNIKLKKALTLKTGDRKDPPEIQPGHLCPLLVWATLSSPDVLNKAHPGVSIDPEMHFACLGSKLEAKKC